MLNFYECDRNSESDCDDCAELISRHLTSSEDDGNRETRNTNRANKSSKNSDNNRSDKAKREIEEAIATLKKYAQWKGKWDFIVSVNFGSKN